MIQKQLLDDAHAALTRGIVSSLELDPLELAFIIWLTPDVAIHAERRKLIESIASTEKRTYRQVAALGMATQTGSLDVAAVTLLSTDLDQLFGREPVVSGTPMPFCMDGLALAGIMLGTYGLGDDALAKKGAAWLTRCCKVTAEGNGLEEWQEWLLRLVSPHVSLPWDGHRSWGPTASVVSVALTVR
jgi:hypothetical protein